MFILKAYNSSTTGEIFHAPVFTDEDYLVYDATLTLGVNKTGSLVFTMPPNNVLFGQLYKLKTIIIVEKDGKEFWRGRVLQTETDFYMRSVVTCEGMLSYLMDSVVKPYTWSKETGNVGAYFKSIVEQDHNPSMDEDKKFIATTDMDDDMYAIESDDYPNSLDELINNAVNIYGGYLKVWYEDGKNHISYTKEPGNYSTQTIEFAENLLDLKWDINAENVFTVLIPHGKSTDDTPLTIASVNDGKDYIESEDGIEAYGRIVQEETWSDIEDASELLETAQEYLAKAVEMATTLTINAADLSLLGVDVDAFNVGDYVRVISLPHGLNGDFLCTEAKIDLLNPGNSEYVFGFEDTLTQNSSGRDRQVAQINKIANKAITIAQQNQEASEFIERLWPRYRANYETEDLNNTPSNYTSVMEWDQNTSNTPYSEGLTSRYTWGTVISRNGTGKYEGVQISLFPGTPYLAIRYRPYNGTWSKWEWLPWQAEIDAMKTDITTNATNIATNAAGIADNKHFIERLWPRYSANYPAGDKTFGYFEDANFPPSNFFSVCDCNADTLHTPYKQGMTECTTGVLLSRCLGDVGSYKNHAIQVMLISGSNRIALRIRDMDGTWTPWEWLPYRSEIETMKTNISTNASNIATNRSNISTNAAGIADNKWFIERLWPRYSTNYPAGDKTFGYFEDANFPPSNFFSICDCGGETLHTPYKQGLTECHNGVLLSRCLGDVGSHESHAIQVMLIPGSTSIALRVRYIDGTWTPWEWLPYRSEIETMKTDISTKAPINHRSTSTDYGLATTTYYGHVKFINDLVGSNAISEAPSTTSGLVASAYQMWYTWRNVITRVLKTGDTMTGNLTLEDSTLHIKDSAFDTSASSRSATVYRSMGIFDKNGRYSTYVQSCEETDGTIKTYIAARRYNSQENVDNILILSVDKNGNKGVWVSDAAAWRTGINAAVTNHATSETTYGLGTTSKYGHVRTINNLTTSSHANGDALSAYQGYVLKQSVDSLAEATYDTGWKTITMASPFEAYSDHSMNALKYRRIGNLVEIKGVLTNTKAVSDTSGTAVTIGTVPEGNRPSGMTISAVMQGSGMNRFNVLVNSSGTISLERYGTTSYTAVPSGSWLNIHMMYFI